MPSIANVSSRSIAITGKPSNYMKRIVSPAFLGYGAAQGWYGGQFSWWGSTGFHATDDYIVVGDPAAYNPAQTYEYSGQVSIHRVSDGAVLQILTNPTHNASTQNEIQALFGYAVAITEYNGDHYVIVTAPDHEPSGGYQPKAYVYKSTDGFATAPSLEYTITQAVNPSSSSTKSYFGRGEQKLDVHGQYFAIGSRRWNSDQGRIQVWSVTSSTQINEITNSHNSNTTNGWTGWNVMVHDDFKPSGSRPMYGYSSPFGQSPTTASAGLREGQVVLYDIQTNGVLYQKHGYQMNNAQKDEYEMASGADVLQDRVIFSAVKEDYDGYSDTGKVFVTTSSGATLYNYKHPMAKSIWNLGSGSYRLNYQSLRGIKTNKSDVFMIGWDQPYSVPGANWLKNEAEETIVRLYNTDGKVLKTYRSPGVQEFDPLRVPTYDPGQGLYLIDSYEPGCISDTYVFLRADSYNNVQTVIFYDKFRPDPVYTINFSTPGGNYYMVQGTDRSGVINGSNRPLSFNVGDQIIFNNSGSATHPLYIKTSLSYGSGNQLAGVTGQGTAQLTHTWASAGTYFYQCSNHFGMYATISVS